MNWGLLEEAGCDITPDARLSEFTTFRLGGRCPCVITCVTPHQLEIAVRDLASAGLSYVLIGGGSNLLVSDEGLPSAVIRYCCESVLIREEDTALDVTASMLLDDLARITAEKGLDGLATCSGIPGTVGGAIAGNAGAFGKQIGDVVELAVLLDAKGNKTTVPGRELEFAYRASRIQKTGEIVVAARLKLRRGDARALQHQREEILEKRRQKHPDWKVLPTAGSFFKNIEPTSKAEKRQAAGYFLEQVGAKAMKVGGARVFEKHANIIIADPGATAQDVLALSRQMAAAVKEKFSLELVPEVRTVGRFV
jgi:UDP-N-acetylmuramate dehydrogenase